MKLKRTLLFILSLLAMSLQSFGCDCNPPCTGCADCMYGICVARDSLCPNDCYYCSMVSDTYGVCYCDEPCCSDSDCTRECHNGCGADCECIDDDSKCSGSTPYCDDGICVQCRNAYDCTNPDETCCGGECFNFHTHMCCGGKVCRQPCCDDWECTYCVEGNRLPCLRKPGNYEELQACSNVVPDPDWTPQPNGCSVPDIICWALGVNCDNPAEDKCGEASSFLNACNAHDTCYQTCGNDRLDCDAAFAWNLYLVCDSLSGEDCRDDCSYWRDKYVGAVLLYGEGAWKTDQVLACACCDC